MDFSGVLSIVFLVVAVILLLPVLIGGIFVVVVVANRAEPDPSGRRPALVYSGRTTAVGSRTSSARTAAARISTRSVTRSLGRRC
jgi:hypothetical protein